MPTALGNTSTVVDDFMLKEYESIAAAHFDCQVGVRQQFRFYLVLLAVPITILGLAFKDRSTTEIGKLGLADLPHFLYYIFIAIGVLGILMLLAMIHTALDALLYAHTVNGVRAFFSDRAKEHGLELSPYLLMPTDKNRPRYFHVRGFFWIVVFVAVVNTAYIVLPLIALYQNYCLITVLALALMAGQFGIYRAFCWIRQRNEVTA